jgi:peptide/nickel transport system permease protein
MTIVFFLMRVLPGDVVLMILGEESSQIDPVQYETMRNELGLNLPLWDQYISWIGNFFRGDMGVSLWTGVDVWDEILVRLPYSLTMIFMAIVISAIVAVPVGVFSAIKQDSIFDYGLRIFAIAGLSIPSFWFGLLILLLFVTSFNWSPPLEYAPVFKNPGIAFQQLILPAIVLGYRSSAVAARMMRSSMLEVMREDYVRTAWAKGLRERVVIMTHAVRNAILPVITLFGLEIVMIFSSAVIVETIFNVPGVGRLLVDAIKVRDVVMVQGVVSFVIIFVLVVNLAIDLIYAKVDPRVRLN